MCEKILDGKNEISYREFMDYRNKVTEALWHYEFHQFERDNHNHITSFDMAQSLYVYYIPFHRIPDYMLHIDQYKEFKKGCCDVD
jgi:hypothetical protein